MMSFVDQNIPDIIGKFQRLLSKDHQIEIAANGNFIIELGGMTQTVCVSKHEGTGNGPVVMALKTPVFVQLAGIKEERLAPMASFAPHFGLTALLPPVDGSEHWSLHTHVNVRRSKSDCMLRLMAGVSALQFYFASERQLWPRFTHEYFDFCNNTSGVSSLEIKRKLRAAVERGLMCTERLPESAADELHLQTRWKRLASVQKQVNRGRQIDLIFDLKEGYAHLRVDLDSFHPVFKIGCSFVLKVFRPDEASERSRQALYYNMESAISGPGQPGLLGSWGTVGHEDDALAYHSFLPRFLYRPGLVSMLLEDSIQRANWLVQQASRKVPRRSTANNYVPRGKPVSLQPGDAESLYITNKLLKSNNAIWPEPLKVSGGFLENGEQQGLFFFGRLNPERPVWNCVGLYRCHQIPDKVFIYHRKLLPSEQMNFVWGVFSPDQVEQSAVFLKWLFLWVEQSCTSRHSLIHEVPSWILPRPHDPSSQVYLRCAFETWGHRQKINWAHEAHLLQRCKAEWLNVSEDALIEVPHAAESALQYGTGSGFRQWWNTMADNDYLASQVEATVKAWAGFQTCPAVHKCPRNCGMCLHLSELAAILNSQGLPILNDHLRFIL